MYGNKFHLCSFTYSSFTVKRQSCEIFDYVFSWLIFSNADFLLKYLRWNQRCFLIFLFRSVQCFKEAVSQSFLFSFFCLLISVVRVPGRLTLKSRYSLGQSIKEAFSSRNPPLMILVAQNIQTFGNTTTTFVFFIQETVQQDFRPLFCSSFESTYATPGVWYLWEIDSTVYRSRGVMFWRILFLPYSTPRGLTREVRFSSFKFK